MTDRAVLSIVDAIESTLISPNESDSNGECANVVDGLFRIARAIDRLASAVQGVDVTDTIKQGVDVGLGVSVEDVGRNIARLYDRTNGIPAHPEAKWREVAKAGWTAYDTHPAMSGATPWAAADTDSQAAQVADAKATVDRAVEMGLVTRVGCKP